MSEPTWLSYFGVVTGSVGAVTGVAGMILGLLGYRRSNSVKVLDLRLELRRAENDLRASVGDLLSLMQYAKTNQTLFSIATGHSGAPDAWLADFGADKSMVKSIEAAYTDAEVEYGALGQVELEGKLVVVHRNQIRARRLQEKYRRAIALVEEQREQVRATSIPKVRGDY